MLGRVSCFAVVSLALVGFLAPNASAVIIVDTPVEITNAAWVNPNGNPWFNTSGVGGGFAGGALIDPLQEGLTAIHSSVNSANFTNADVSGGSAMLQEGIYTIYFSVGDFAANNFFYVDGLTAGGLPALWDLEFAGLTRADASSSTTPEPASGEWELWSLTWNVSDTNPNLTNPLNFSLTGNTTSNLSLTNGAFDGVGGLAGAPAGTSGFVVEFTSSVIPEPGSVAILSLLGLMGLGCVRFRRK